MKREIKKGITILHTQDEHIGIKNKYNCKGISTYGDRFRVEISIGHNNPEKYLIGIFDNLPDACKARQIAEAKKRAGSLKQWIASKPHANSKAIIGFWENEFKRMDEQ